MGFPGGSVVKNPSANAGDTGLIPGSGRSPGGGHGNRLQYSCLENPMDRGAWQATVHGVEKSRTQLKQLCTLTQTIPKRLYHCVFPCYAKSLQSCPILGDPHGL